MQIYWKSAGNIPIYIMGSAAGVGLLSIIFCILFFRRQYYIRRTKSFRKSMRKASRASMGLGATDVASVYNMGMSQMGMNPMVMSQMDMSQMGMNSMAMSQMDMSQMGMNPMAMSKMGMSQMGMQSAPSFAMPQDCMYENEGMIEKNMSQRRGGRGASFVGSC